MSKTLQINTPAGMTADQALADAVLRPEVTAAAPAMAHAGSLAPGLEPSALIAALEARRDDSMESVLTAQANLLHLIFCDSMTKAAGADSARVLALYSNLGLKAQAQCRQTVEALGQIRNPAPRVQTNIAGIQQVNNGASPNGPNELSPEHGRPPVATVDALNRPTNERGQGPVLAERAEARVIQPGRSAGATGRH